MYRLKSLGIIILCCLISTVSCSQESGDFKLEIGSFDLEDLGWGRHSIPINVTNKRDLLKYVTVITDVRCSGTRLSPQRRLTRNLILNPDESIELDAILWVPGNYGRFDYEVALYDVVDTLDLLLSSQLFHSQTGSFEISPPESVEPYLEKQIGLPPMVGQHLDFDSDFSRIAPFLVTEGKTVNEIADVAGCNTSYVRDYLNHMSGRGYYQRGKDTYKTGIAAISATEAKEEFELAKATAEKVANRLAENLGTYWKKIDSLVAAGALTGDSNSFLDGGSVLYRPYPVVAALSLWFDLGSRFINGESTFWLFEGSDFCNAFSPYFSYTIEGGDEFGGQSFYAMMKTSQSYQVYFGDTIPQIICPEGFMFRPAMGMSVNWEYVKEFFPETFVMDSSILRPMLDHLSKGVNPVLDKALEELRTLSEKHGKTFLFFGHRYWFWNIVATSAVEQLVAQGKLKPRGNGQFRFEGYNF